MNLEFVRSRLPLFWATVALLALAGCADGAPMHPDGSVPAGSREPSSLHAGNGRTAVATVRVRVLVPYAVSVIARVADRDADLGDPRNFNVRRCIALNTGDCTTSFELTPGARYVFSTEPLRIDDPADHLIWANDRPVPVFESFRPSFEPTVFVQSDVEGADYADGSSLRKIDENLDLAFARARPLPAGGTPLITLGVRTEQVRVNACTGVPNGTYVFGGVLFDPMRWSAIPVSPTPNSPAIAQYATRFDTGRAAPCEMVTARDRTVILKGFDYVANRGYSGSIAAFDTGPANLTPDEAYIIQHYIPDPLGDATPDADYMTFGLVVGSPDRLHWKVNTRGLVGAQQRTSSWEFHFLFRTSPGSPEQTLRASVRCSEAADGACAVVSVDPGDLTTLLIRRPEHPDEFGRVDSVTGVGYVQLLIDVTKIHSARLFARSFDNTSATERLRDFIPDQGLTAEYLNIFDGYAHWSAAADLARGRSRSVFIPW